MFLTLSIILFISFYGSYILKAILLKRKGIDTNRLGKGDKPKKTMTVEAALKCLTFLTITLQALCIVLYARGNFFIFIAKHNYIGIFISTVGVVIFIISIITMKDSWRAGIDKKQKTELVTNGIYKISRNPAFLGFDLFYIGFTFMFANIILIAMSLISIIFLHIQIMEEEKFLANAFGEKYAEYKKKTARYFIF